MKKLFKICLQLSLAAFFSSLIFVSCASAKTAAAENTPAVFITNTKKINILTAENILKPVDEVQLFEGTFGDKSFSLPVYIQADEKGISLSILNDFGTSMGELSYAGNSVEFSSALFPENLKAEYIVWDIQLALYKAEAIEGCLSKKKINFTVERNDGAENFTEIRRIYDGKISAEDLNKNLIEEITIKKNFIEIKNYLRGYDYKLTGVGDE